MDDREYEKRRGRLSRALYRLVIWAEDHRVDFAGALENAYTRLHAENDQNVKDFLDRMGTYAEEDKNPIWWRRSTRGAASSRWAGTVTPPTRSRDT